MTDRPTSPVDLLVRADRVFSADLDLDGPGAVAVTDGRIVASGPDARDLPAKRIMDLGETLLLPGLLDMHAHPDKRANGSRYGVDPDREFLPRGVTTVLSQGDAGSTDLQAYRSATIGTSRTRILLALNLSRFGEQGDGPSLEDHAALDVDRIVRAAQRDNGRLWGIAVNTMVDVTGTNDPRQILDRAIEASEAADGPLLFGTRHASDVSLDEQLARLRPGDVVTYCFSGMPENLLDDETGQVRTSVREARERGVVFDVGHGMKSFDWRIAEAAIAQGFPPDTISTDQYRAHVGSSPQHDLPRTISKLIAAGMPEADAFRAATWRPAEVLRVAPELGSLAPNALADLCGLRWNPDGQLADTGGVSRSGGCWEPVFVAHGGEIVRAPEESDAV
jgi:dihydroorotase